MSFLSNSFSAFAKTLAFKDEEMEQHFWLQREVDFLYRQDQYFMYVKTVVETVILIDALKDGHKWNSAAIIWSYLGLGLPLLHLLILWMIPLIYQKNRLYVVNIHKVLAAISITQTGRLGRLSQPQSTGNALMNLLEVSGVLAMVAHSIGFVIPFRYQIQMQLSQLIFFVINVKPICDKSMPTEVYNQIQGAILKALKSFHSIATAIATMNQGGQGFVDNYYSCPALILTMQIVIGIFMMCTLNFHMELTSRLRYLSAWQEAQQSRSSGSRNSELENEVCQWKKKMQEFGVFQGGWGIVTLQYSIVASLSTLIVWSVVSFIFLRQRV
eukprot:TRINITY_DN4770_c0_g1_i3.p1 TRINITY_DN4770_c0_g1~~TRINITY_DN4770_c0_g1_i3.p1  ORF type:complete len:327 (-),score=25.67 TRINITY_DN4770_c0_g1_i3:1452-2432(-)